MSNNGQYLTKPIKGQQMQHAKVHSTTLLKFPFTWESLREENPFTAYDSRFTVAEWYAQTEDATNSGSVVVEVLEQERPAVDFSRQKVTKSAEPVLIGDVWTLAYKVIDLTEEEINSINSNSTDSVTPSNQKEKKQLLT